MNNRNKKHIRQSGYTLPELMLTIFIAAVLVGVVTFWGTVIYVAYHFISRFW